MTVNGNGAERRLNSWKEIAGYFGKDERTVKRWETQRGLPVHRVPGGTRTSVYAYAAELDRWLRGEARAEEPAAPLGARATAAAARGEAPLASLTLRQRGAIAAMLALLVVALAGGGLAYQRGLATGGGAEPTPLAGRESPGAHQPPEEAVELYLAGLFNWEKRTPESLNRALQAFNEAIARDPNYAEAYVGLANCYNLLREYTLMPAAEAYPRAREAAERAVALNDALADAHTALAFVEFYWTRDIERAQREFERALELDPNSVRAHHWFATALLHMGEFEYALREITKAQTLEPQSRAILADKGLILFYAGRGEEAVALLTQLAASEPDYLSPPAYLAAIHFAKGEYADFLTQATKAATLLQDDNRLAIVEAAGRGFAAGGESAMLQAMLEKQQELYAAGRGSAWSLAQTYAVTGETSAALSYLRLSVDRKEEYVMAIRIEPAFAALHADETFRGLVREVGMPLLEGEDRRSG